VRDGVLVRELAEREQVLPAEQLARALDLRAMTEIGVPGSLAQSAPPAVDS
jgi:hypothetical protein